MSESRGAATQSLDGRWPRRAHIIKDGGFDGLGLVECRDIVEPGHWSAHLPNPRPYIALYLSLTIYTGSANTHTLPNTHAHSLIPIYTRKSLVLSVCLSVSVRLCVCVAPIVNICVRFARHDAHANVTAQPARRRVADVFARASRQSRRRCGHLGHGRQVSAQQQRADI